MKNYDYEAFIVQKTIKTILSCKTTGQLQTATYFMRLAEKRIKSHWPRSAVADQFGLDMILLINQRLDDVYDQQNPTNN